MKLKAKQSCVQIEETRRNESSSVPQTGVSATDFDIEEAEYKRGPTFCKINFSLDLWH